MDGTEPIPPGAPNLAVGDGVALPAMPSSDAPRAWAPKLILPHGDPVAVEVARAIHSGDLDALGRLLSERPELASAHMIGRKGLEGGWRTPLHAASDWPGYFPAAPAAVALLLEAGADPNEDTGGACPETPPHWAASTDDLDVAIPLTDGGAELETSGGSIGTPLDNAIGYSCWHAFPWWGRTSGTVTRGAHARRRKPKGGAKECPSTKKERTAGSFL